MRLLLVVLVVFLSACGAKNNTAKKETTQAVPLWEQDIENTTYEFYKSVSNTLLRTNQPLKALKSIEKLLKLKPKNAEPYYLMGRAYLALEDYPSSRKALRKALEKNKKYARASSLLGMSYDMTGQHREAIVHHQNAIDLDKESAEYLNNLGFCYYLQKKYDLAVHYYKKAVDLSPGSKRIYNNLGFAYGGLKKMNLAYQSFKLAGLPAQATNNMGFVYETNGELTIAYNYYMGALEQDPILIQAQKNLKRVCQLLGRSMPKLEGADE